VQDAGGFIAPPDRSSVAVAAMWADRLLRDSARLTQLGVESRELAEQEFALEGCADEFEGILSDAAGR
jgi:colanic acid biosynthesis glycosyl transferase WcaI